MKKTVFFLLGIVSVAVKAETYKTSQTFLFTRPLFHAVFAQQQVWNDIINGEICSGDKTAQAIFMYQKNKPYAPNSAYFLLDCQSCISVKGDQALINPAQIPAQNQRNVRAEWLNLPGSFDGILSLNPRQEEFGTFLECNYNLGQLTGLSFFRSWWFDFFMPFMVVKNDINPQGAPELLSAMNNPTWYGARITGEELKKFGVPEIRFNLGTTLYNRDNFVLAYYTGIAIPTVNRYPHTYLFEPLLGVNGHIAFINGLTMELPLWSNEHNSDLRILFNAKNDWYLAHNQKRTFDLWDKPWSRYMQFRRQGEAETVSGVNLFSREVGVHPNNMFEIDVALRLKKGGFYGEIGYSLWGHGDERIDTPEKKCESQFSCLEQYGIAGDAVVDQHGITWYSSASKSTISTLINDPIDTFVTLSVDDIYFCSGKARGGIVNRGEASIAYAFQNDALISCLGFGAYFEVPLGNTLLKNGEFGASSA